MDYNKNISVYANYRTPVPAMDISILDFCQNVGAGDFQIEVEGIRNEPDKAKRDKIKATLPAVTISGTFSERKKAGLIEHSGFIAIDIDAKDNPKFNDWNNTRDIISTSPNVLFAALSVSGRGVFALVPISNPEQHEPHFDSLVRDFAHHGFNIDKSCRDVSRLRGMSFDPDAKITHNAKPYERIYAPEPDRRPIRRSGNPGNQLDQMIDMVIGAGVDITNGYENWFSIGRALANELGEGGRTTFHRISQAYHKYSDTKTDKQFDACLRSPGNTTGATIFHLAKEYGITLK